MIERRGGAPYQVPNGREVDPTAMKLWALAVQVALLAAFAAKAVVQTLPRIW